jgi:hypothetical protein
MMGTRIYSTHVETAASGSLGIASMCVQLAWHGEHSYEKNYRVIDCYDALRAFAHNTCHKPKATYKAKLAQGTALDQCQFKARRAITLNYKPQNCFTQELTLTLI